jgi:hypothetical protein
MPTPPPGDPIQYIKVETTSPVAGQACSQEQYVLNNTNWYITLTYDLNIINVGGISFTSKNNVTTADPHRPTDICCFKDMDGNSVSIAMPTLKAAWDRIDTLMIDQDTSKPPLREQSTERVLMTASCPLAEPVLRWTGAYWVSPGPSAGQKVTATFKKTDTTSRHRLRILSVFDQNNADQAAQLVCTFSPVSIEFTWPGGTLYYEFQWCSPKGWVVYPQTLDGLGGATVPAAGGPVVPKGHGPVAITIKAQPPKDAPPGLSEATFSW